MFGPIFGYMVAKFAYYETNFKKEALQKMRRLPLFQWVDAEKFPESRKLANVAQFTAHSPTFTGGNA